MSPTDYGRGVYMQQVASRLQVWVPHNPEFIVFAHICDARWKKRSQMWSFKHFQYDKVATKLNGLFGTSIPMTGRR